MGNSGSTGGSGRRRHGRRRTHHFPPGEQPPQPPEVTSNRYVVAAATTYPPQYPSPNPPPQYYQYPAYYPPPPPAMPMPLPAPYDHHHHHQPPRGGGGPPHAEQGHGNWVGGRYPCGPVMMMPYVEHQKAVTIRNAVNIKKETLRIEPDEENPGKFLVSFTFDATVDGRISLVFFAKEVEDCSLGAMKQDLLPPVMVEFKEGLGQKFKQPSGTGIEFSMFEETDLRYSNTDVYPLAVKAEASLGTQKGPDGNAMSGTVNSQITQAVFEKEKGEYQVRVVKQILWVNGMRYELQEIYGIGNSVESDVDGNDPGKECVICLSEPRDTTVLPCRHMCMCSGCAKVLRFQTNRCPICRQPVERLLEIKVSGASDE